MRLMRFVPVLLVLALAGCGSVGAISFPSFGKKTTENAAPPLDPSVVPPAEQGQTPPAQTQAQGGQPSGDATVAEALPNGTDANAPAATAPTPAPQAAGAIGR